MKPKDRLLALGLTLPILLGVSCSSGGGDGGVPAPQIYCYQGGLAPPDVVVLRCAGAIDSVTERLDVVLGGPASGSVTLSGFNFDVVYAPSNLQFEPDPVYTSPLLPSALIGVTLFDGQEGRLVVSVQQPRSLPDVSVDPGQHVVLSLSFRAASSAFAPSPLTFDNAEVTGASAAISYGSGLLLSYP